MDRLPHLELLKICTAVRRIERKFITENYAPFALSILSISCKIIKELVKRT